MQCISRGGGDVATALQCETHIVECSEGRRLKSRELATNNNKITKMVTIHPEGHVNV